MQAHLVRARHRVQRHDGHQVRAARAQQNGAHGTRHQEDKSLLQLVYQILFEIHRIVLHVSLAGVLRGGRTRHGSRN